MVAEGIGGFEARVQGTSPLEKHDIRRLPEGRSLVQGNSPLATKEHELLGAWFDEHPDADLRVWGTLPTTLDFLRHYPGLNHFTLDSRSRDLTDASGLQHLPDTLISLGIDVPLPGNDHLQT